MFLKRFDFNAQLKPITLETLYLKRKTIHAPGFCTLKSLCHAWKTLYKNRCLFRSHLTFPIERFATPTIFNWRNYMSLEFRLQKQLPSPNNSTENLNNNNPTHDLINYTITESTILESAPCCFRRS